MRLCLFILSFSGRCFSFLFHQFFFSPLTKIIQLIQPRFPPKENRYFLSHCVTETKPLWLLSMVLLSKRFQQIKRCSEAYKGSFSWAVLTETQWAGRGNCILWMNPLLCTHPLGFSNPKPIAVNISLQSNALPAKQRQRKVN